jgi:hypothetical protein
MRRTVGPLPGSIEITSAPPDRNFEAMSPHPFEVVSSHSF